MAVEVEMEADYSLLEYCVSKGRLLLVRRSGCA